MNASNIPVYRVTDPLKIRQVERDIKERTQSETGFLQHLYTEPTLVSPKRVNLEDEREKIEQGGGRVVYRDVGGEIYAHPHSPGGIHTECIYTVQSYSSRRDRDENISRLVDIIMDEGEVDFEGHLVESYGDVYVSETKDSVGVNDKQLLGTGSYIFKTPKGDRRILTRGCYQVENKEGFTLEQAVRESAPVLGINPDTFLDAVHPVKNSVIDSVVKNYSVSYRDVEKGHSQRSQSDVRDTTLCVVSRPSGNAVRWLGYTR